MALIYPGEGLTMSHERNIQDIVERKQVSTHNDPRASHKGELYIHHIAVVFRITTIAIHIKHQQGTKPHTIDKILY
jgi:hypothetical protein